MTPTLLTRNPCIGVCEDNKSAICKGCGRSRPEIDGWRNLSAQERHEINLRVLATQGKKVRRKLLKEFSELAEKEGFV